MIKSKWTVIIAPVLVLALTAAVFLLQTPKQLEIPRYQTELFHKDIVNIDISVDEEMWQNMLDNAKNEEFISCDLTIDGTKVSAVGIRPKGNSSLTQVESSGSDRFSFRVSFDEYIAGQNYMGLDQMVLNNSQGDNTFMKDYITYDLMEYMGVSAPLTAFVNLTVNGEQFGTYLAVEFYGDAYEIRTTGSSSGNIYSVKMTMGGGKGNMGDAPDNVSRGFDGKMPQMSGGDMPQMPEGFEGKMPEGAENGGEAPGVFEGKMPWGDMPQSENGEEAPQMPSGFGGFEQGQGGGFGGFGGFGGAGGGGDLVYTDDNPASYSSIFENAIGKTTSAAEDRMISAIKALNTGENLEEYWDVDKALRYLAVHTFVVNLDSYSGSMKQNYALYEKDGVVQVLPWDYNLAFGGFMGGDTTSAINFPIDTPVSGANMQDRPLINTLLSNDEYRAKYYEYLNTICTEYVGGGILESKLYDAKAAISPYVETDPTKFCTFEEFETAVDALLVFCTLRGQSIQKQLSGEIPSTTDGQKNADNLIQADGELGSAMGSGFGGGGQGNGFGRQEKGEKPAGTSETDEPQREERQNFGREEGENMRKMRENKGENPRNMPGGGGFPQGEHPQSGTNLTAYLPVGICALVFILGFVFVLIWKRKY